MSDIAIKVRGLSKRYVIGKKLRENKLSIQILDKMKEMLRRSSGPKPEEAHIWALKDIDFDIKEGESVGIIGRNGAGKSTLLKVISNVTTPTTGRVDVYGKIGSLLEVGTGFHPELTGRQNVYLSATIHGMERKRIAALFDAIVDFAGIETFIDTPVKHYSSGMYMRLAFSVSAFAETDILIVDEVLAVGDSQFQKKCIAKMQETTKQGRTLLFVSHQLGLIANVCERSILLNKGQKLAEGPSSEVILQYINQVEAADGHDGEIVWNDSATAPATSLIRLNSIRICSQGKASGSVDIDKDIEIETAYTVLKSGHPMYLGIQLYDSEGALIFITMNFKSSNLDFDQWSGKIFPEGLYRTTCTIPANFLNEGNYSIGIFIMTNEAAFVELAKPHILSFTVRETGEMRAEFMGIWPGMMRPKLAWQTQQIEGDAAPT